MPVKGAAQIAIFVGGFLFLFPNLCLKPSILLTMFYGVMTLAFHLFGNTYFKTINNVVVPLLYMLAGLIIFEYVVGHKNDRTFIKLSVVTVMVANIIMALISIPQLMLYPNIMRDSFMLAGEEAAVYSWLMSYSNVHGIPLIIALLVQICFRYFKVSKILFILWIVATIILLGVVFFSNSTTALIISILSLILSLLFRFEKFTKKIIVKLIVIGGFAFLFVQPSVLVPILKTFQSYMDPSSGNYQKMDEIESSLVYGDKIGDWSARGDLYESSSKLFWESPILGTFTPEKIGRHSWIVDHLALFGLFFIIPLILIFYNWSKRSYVFLTNSRVIFVCSLFCWFLMLYLKAEFGAGTWLYGFALIPIFCKYSEIIIVKK